MTRSDRLAIAGDGQMAVALAVILGPTGTAATLWSPFPRDAAQMQRGRISPRMPEVRLPGSAGATADAAELFRGATLAVNAIPTQFIREAWQSLAPHVPPGLPIVSVAKGIEEGSLLRPSQVLQQVVPLSPVAVLSGPTIAAELVRNLPAAMVAAAEDADLAERVQAAFTLRNLRIYTNADVVGVEIAGAAKNVVAIAAGIIDGLGLGSNAKSALLARGLAEIVRLGTALGARAETFFGVAGVGDLATTCFSPEGRNRSCGQAIGAGESLQEHMARTRSVVEGVATARSLLALAEQNGVDMPIAGAVESILFHGIRPADAIRELMGRAAGMERVG